MVSFNGGIGAEFLGFFSVCAEWCGLKLKTHISVF